MPFRSYCKDCNHKTAFDVPEYKGPYMLQMMKVEK